jgi:hypothetical protein
VNSASHPPHLLPSGFINPLLPLPLPFPFFSYIPPSLIPLSLFFFSVLSLVHRSLYFLFLSYCSFFPSLSVNSPVLFLFLLISSSLSFVLLLLSLLLTFLSPSLLYPINFHLSSNSHLSPIPSLLSLLRLSVPLIPSLFFIPTMHHCTK